MFINLLLKFFYSHFIVCISIFTKLHKISTVQRQHATTHTDKHYPYNHTYIGNKHLQLNVVISLPVTSSTDPGRGLDTNGNCNHVEVDLNSLNIFEKDILIVNPSSVATSTCTTKYLPGIGRNRQ